jgi:hypothetical protein
VLVGGGRKKLEGPETEKATMGKMKVAADTDAATRMEYETNQKAIADAVIKEKARLEMERRRLGPQPMSCLAAKISKGEVGSRGIGKLSMLGPAETTTKTAANDQLRARKTQTEANRDTQVAENRGKVQTKAPIQSTAVEAKEAQGSVSKAAAATTGVVSRTMGAAKFAVAKATTVWSSRSATTSTEKPMVESDTASGRETPRIQNSATAQQSNDCEMSDDTKGSAAEKSELETGVTTTDSEFISMGLAGFENQSMAMEDNETEARKEWQMVEERELDQGAYRVRYEYSEKMDSAPRSTSFELRSLALELWRADPYLEIASFDPLMYPIRGIDSFPASTEEYQRFFARMSTEKNGQRTHIFGFTIRTMHPLNVLSQRNGKALQGFLSGRKTWLRQHQFNTLLV